MFRTLSSSSSSNEHAPTNGHRYDDIMSEFPPSSVNNRASRFGRHVECPYGLGIYDYSSQMHYDFSPLDTSPIEFLPTFVSPATSPPPLMPHTFSGRDSLNAERDLADERSKKLQSEKLKQDLFEKALALVGEEHAEAVQKLRDEWKGQKQDEKLESALEEHNLGEDWEMVGMGNKSECAEETQETQKDLEMQKLRGDFEKLSEEVKKLREKFEQQDMLGELFGMHSQPEWS